MDNSTLSIWITFLDKIYYTETKRARLHEPICELGNAFDIIDGKLECARSARAIKFGKKTV